MKYADLVIDNRSDQTDSLYTYGFDDHADDLNIKKGSKVYVDFGTGKNKREAYVFDIKDKPERQFKKIRLIDRADEHISLTEEMVRTCIWMKKRYLCRYIDAVRQFVPAGKPLKKGKRPSPFADETGEEQMIENLTEDQSRALSAVRSKDGHEIILLHGVTGSGKTELYMRIIEDCLEEGKSAVMLVPEISLTKQTIDRFIGRFGAERIAVLHSRLSKGERYDEWMRIRNNEADIVIGARSAVFAPVSNAGVFIMDEEHEGTYKSEKTPRYDTVEVAVKRAMDMDAKVILGSATPSAVSYQRSESGLYRRIEMNSRYNEVMLPSVSIVAVCPECGSRYIKFFGTGTEKIDEEVASLFPGHKAARLDMDTMRRKGSLEKILRDFGSGRTRILTGTQVVAKGLDFRNVGLTGIISADVSLNIPDYRSPERTFQLITQAAGRAGRGDERGKVIIQTFAPDNYAVTAAAKHDYKAFYRQEIQFRRMRGYPPFSDFIQIIIASSMEDTALAVANEWERVIRSHLGNDGKNVLPNTSMNS